MYGKIFDQIFDSSIAEDWHLRHVFMDLIVLSDPEGVLDMTQESIARRTNAPVELVRSVIERLCKPDPRSRNPEGDGRRLVPLDDHRDWGWRIVNYSHYRNMKNNEERKKYMREYMREYRSKDGVNNESLQEVYPSLQELTSASVSSSSSSSEEREEVINEKTKMTDFQLFWQAYPKKFGKAAAENAFKNAKDKPPIGQVLIAIEAANKSEQWRKEGGQFIPYPATWLNQGRWADEIVAAIRPDLSHVCPRCQKPLLGSVCDGMHMSCYTEAQRNG